jgi:hypothetical protein
MPSAFSTKLRVITRLIVSSALLWLACGEMSQSEGNELSLKEFETQAFQATASGQWRSTGALNTARRRHTATPLHNGQVLVTGGYGAGGARLASTEVYDRSTGMWSTTGSMAMARIEPTLTLLPSGKVLVTGGEGPGGILLASTEVYDPTTGMWSTTGSMAMGRLAHTTTLLLSGKVLVTGGRGSSGSLASAEVYDPATGVWSLTGSLLTDRLNHTAALLPSGKVLVKGGHRNSLLLSSAEVYDPVTGAWSPTNSMAMTRYDHTATMLPSGRALVVGGRDPDLASTEVYDPATGTWSTTGALATARHWHTATLLPSGKVLVSGGLGPSGYLASAEMYNPTTEGWSPTGSMAMARSEFTATLLTTGRVLVSGGIGSSGLLASTEVYIPVIEVLTPANGSTTNNNRPTYSGMAEPGSIVTVFVDGMEVGIRTVDASGTWSVAQPAALVDGSHMVRARATDAVGNISADSNTNTFTVDATPPGSPVISTPANGATTNGRPTYSGTVEAGSIVIVFVKGAVVDATMADASGNWSLEQRVALVDNSHVVMARAMDAAGNTGADSNTNTFTVDATPPPPPVVTTPSNGSRTNNNRPIYRGDAEEGSTVTVFVDGEEVGTTTADTSGKWSVAQPAALADSIHKVRAQATDSVGNTNVALNTNIFTVTAVMVTTPANGATSIDIRPIYSGRAEAGSSVIVFVDGMEVGTTTVDGTGMWNFAQPEALSVGHHTVRARATDAVSNTGTDSDTNTFTIMQMSHYGWSCATTPLVPATWALLALALFLGRRHRSR